MPKAEWGKKVVCEECGSKFYDLNRKYPLPCPSCEFLIQQEIDVKPSSTAKKVYEDDLESTVDDNLIGSDASESMLVDEDADIEMDDEDDTISLEDADTDVDNDIVDIDPSLDDLPIDAEDSSLEDK